MKAKKGEVKPVLVDAPEFRSEAEEAKWWDRHQDLIADLLLKHGRCGAVPTKNVSSGCRLRILSGPESWPGNGALATRP